MTNNALRVDALNEEQVQNSLDPANIYQADGCRMYGFYSLQIALTVVQPWWP